MKLNKYICLFVCILCATTTSFAKKNKTSEEVEQTVAEDVVEETSTEEVAAEAPAVEAPAEASEVSAEEVAAEPAPAEETVADATAAEEVAEASGEAVEESEEVSDDDDEEVVEKKSKKKKKKKKKKKSKKKKKKKHSDDDEDFDEGATGVKLGFHAGLGSNVLELEHGANASLNLGLGFAYFFTNNMAVVSGADLSIAVTQSKYSYNSIWYSYEYTVNNAVASIVVPVKFRFAFNDMFWAEAGSGVILSLYSYNMYSGDNKPADGGATTFIGDITNFTLGAGVKVGGGSLGLEIGYRSVLSVGVNYNSGF